MRLRPGEAVAVFNAAAGEWRAVVPAAAAGRPPAALLAEAPMRPPAAPPDVWLMFAPLKKARTDYAVEKAVELGCARILPVLTDRTNAERVRQDRLQAHAVEAAEQCGALWVPEVAPAMPLAQVLAGWPAGRRLWWCDEALAGMGAPAGGRPPAFAPGPAAILIGPEGGFSPAERTRLAALPFAAPLRLGPRILRAETAAAAALVLWQTAAGDWR